jgi:hypothetical protein
MHKMKLFKLFLLLTGSFLSAAAFSQNVQLNILTRNSGMVSVQGTIFLEVTVCNTDSRGTAVPAYKLRPQLSFPSEIVSIPDTGHILPPGWAIIHKSGGVVRLSNGTDQIPASECRTILIAIKGNVVGGPSSILGTINFSNGIEPGSVSGSPILGDYPADNSSSTAVKVVK